MVHWWEKGWNVPEVLQHGGETLVIGAAAHDPQAAFQDALILLGQQADGQVARRSDHQRHLNVLAVPDAPGDLQLRAPVCQAGLCLLPKLLAQLRLPHLQMKRD